MEFKFDIENLPEPAVLVKMLKGLGWTDHEIARKTKIPQSTITRLKNGLRKNITLQAYTDLLRVAREGCQDE